MAGLQSGEFGRQGIETFFPKVLRQRFVADDFFGDFGCEKNIAWLAKKFLEKTLPKMDGNLISTNENGIGIQAVCIGVQGGNHSEQIRHSKRHAHTDRSLDVCDDDSFQSFNDARTFPDAVRNDSRGCGDFGRMYFGASASDNHGRSAFGVAWARLALTSLQRSNSASTREELGWLALRRVSMLLSSRRSLPDKSGVFPTCVVPR